MKYYWQISHTVTILVITLTSVLCGTGSGYAAEITEISDAADDLNNDPFDVVFEASFKQTRNWGKITREWNCNSDPAQNPDFMRCPTEDTILFNKELDYERVTNQMDLYLEIGLYKDLAIHVNVPIVFSDERKLTFARDDDGPCTDLTKCVDNRNSTIDPADNRISADYDDGGTFDTFRYFQVGENGNTGPSRSGLGDMNIGIEWAAFNDQRDDTKATLTLAFDYFIPSGETQEAGNTGVGSGVHELHFAIGASRRFRYLDPYLQLKYMLPFAASDSPFKDYGQGQSIKEPGQRADIIFGTEIVPFENIEKGQKFAIDLGFHFGYTSEGRDFSPISDAIMGSRACQGTSRGDLGSASHIQCGWITNQANLADNYGVALPTDETNYYHNGVTDIEAYGVYGLWLGFYIQATDFFEFRTRARLDYQQEHFITNARAGVDLNGNQQVDFDDLNEVNPVYNTSTDSIGQRFRFEESTVFIWDISLSLQF